MSHVLLSIFSESELCLIRLRGDRYVRGVCYEGGYDGNPTILLVDYGNMMLVSLENIRVMPSQLLFPSLRVKVIIKGKSYDSFSYYIMATEMAFL